MLQKSHNIFEVCTDVVRIEDLERELKHTSSIFMDSIRPDAADDDFEVCNLLGINLTMLTHLRSLCRPSNSKIVHKNEDDLRFLYSEDLEDVELCSLKFLKGASLKRNEFLYLSTKENVKLDMFFKEKDKRKNIESLAVSYQGSVLNSTNNIENANIVKPFSRINLQMNEKEEEILLLISIRSNLNNKSVSEEYLISPDSELCVFKNIINCAIKKQYVQDAGQSVKSENTKTFDESYTDSFFFINGCIYYDNPDENDKITVGKKFHEWCRNYQDEESLNFTDVTIKQMKNVKFKDLAVSFGVPYLFCHLMNCEHIFVFKNLRSVSPREKEKFLTVCVDPKTGIEQKIYCVFKERNKVIFCSVCNTKKAVIATRHDILAFDDPCYFCEECFQQLHFDEKDKPIARFCYYRLNY